MKRLRVPARFSEATLGGLSTVQMAPVLKYAKTLSTVASSGIGLLLAGKPGVGKTWAMVALTRAWAELGRDYEFVTAPEFFGNLEAAAWGKGGMDDYRDQSFDVTYTRVGWLVLNDLGKEYRGGKKSEQVAYWLGRVLRARSERKLITHITTNMIPTLLTQTYGESITSLMRETLRAVVVGGEDRRGQ